MGRIFPSRPGRTSLTLSSLKNPTQAEMHGFRPVVIEELVKFCKFLIFICKGATMEEIWKPIPGYEDYYEASSLGRIKRLAGWRNGRWGKIYVEEKLLTPHDCGRGYCQVKFCVNGIRSQPSLHRLIAMTFIPNPSNLPQVNHKDGNKLNNNVENLEWCTCAENSQHRSRVLKKWVGHPKKPVRCIDTDEVYESSHHASRALDISQGAIFSACQGKMNKAGGLRFEFV